MPDDRYLLDRVIVSVGRLLIEKRLDGRLGNGIYKFAGVGRVIYTSALLGLIEGEFQTFADFPDWLQTTQAELAEWLRGAPKRKSQVPFLEMADLESYRLLPHARSDPRGQFE